MVQAVREVRERLPNVFLVACFDQYPFSLASALLGLEQTMVLLHDDEALVEQLMACCTDYAVAYGQALAAAGADLLSGGDSPAGLLGPRLFREVALPWEQRVIAQLKNRTGLPVSLHICGNATPLLPDLGTTGADVLELDYQADMVQACRVLPQAVAIWGNLDPVGVLAQGCAAEVRNAARGLIQLMREEQRRFVLSSGCTLAVETPAGNLHALREAAEHTG
jgi:MtaA/CmuA family methyltransferase